jgi:bacillithiol system protein YtxJ
LIKESRAYGMTNMWQEITERNQLEELSKQSGQEPVLIFKHSTRCGISSMALNRLERSWSDQDSNRIRPFLLDIIQHCDISNAVASTFNVEHESPQVLIIRDGKCVYDASHMGINHADILDAV